MLSKFQAMAQLYNRVNKELLKQQLATETFSRKTISFYRYVIMEDAGDFRNAFYIRFSQLNCLGRIYVAREGINAQMSVPEHNMEEFLNYLDSITYLKNMPIKYAVEDDGKSFYKLIVRLRNKILADGLDDNSYDVTNVGNHLTALQFHQLAQKEDTLVIDMRNRYESEIGHFKTAYCPDVDTFRDEILMVTEKFKHQKDKKVLLYCTGGIRCEKASAFLKHKGFKDVNQLYGGDFEFIQFWVNAPARNKMYNPSYQPLTEEETIKIESEDGKVRVGLVAGEFKGHKGKIIK